MLRRLAARSGVDSRYIEKLFDHVVERGLEADLLYLQRLDLADILSIKFRKPDTGEYEAIERLAHGQKCTAILVVALADGKEPLIIDQPEDAFTHRGLRSTLYQDCGSYEVVGNISSPLAVLVS